MSRRPASCPRAPHPRASASSTAASWRSPLTADSTTTTTLLARFDVVVASLHVGRRQPRAQLMARYELAMRSPHVDIISHPSGRKIGQRPDLDLDWEAFYRLAAETGTLLEINGSEARLDLEPQRIRAARAAGCDFVISSDAHERAEWRHLDCGVAMARRGWLEAGAVANSLPLDGFLAVMREKPHRLPV